MHITGETMLVLVNPDDWVQVYSQEGKLKLRPAITPAIQELQGKGNFQSWHGSTHQLISQDLLGALVAKSSREFCTTSSRQLPSTMEEAGMPIGGQR
mmetsp:Transcript_30229/g.44675  ORF Transcript_30229/g.44675 Transcript_30229/m.44675 type:complete len:97 (-) Transcript_30229:359-649(-)